MVPQYTPIMGQEFETREKIFNSLKRLPVGNSINLGETLNTNLTFKNSYQKCIVWPLYHSAKQQHEETKKKAKKILRERPSSKKARLEKKELKGFISLQAAEEVKPGRAVSLVNGLRPSSRLTTVPGAMQKLISTPTGRFKYLEELETGKKRSMGEKDITGYRLKAMPHRAHWKYMMSGSSVPLQPRFQVAGKQLQAPKDSPPEECRQEIKGYPEFIIEKYHDPNAQMKKKPPISEISYGTDSGTDKAMVGTTSFRKPSEESLLGSEMAETVPTPESVKTEVRVSDSLEDIASFHEVSCRPSSQTCRDHTLEGQMAPSTTPEPPVSEPASIWEQDDNDEHLPAFDYADELEDETGKETGVLAEYTEQLASMGEEPVEIFPKTPQPEEVLYQNTDRMDAGAEFTEQSDIESRRGSEFRFHAASVDETLIGSGKKALGFDSVSKKEKMADAANTLKDTISDTELVSLMSDKEDHDDQHIGADKQLYNLGPSCDHMWQVIVGTDAALPPSEVHSVANLDIRFKDSGKEIAKLLQRIGINNNELLSALNPYKQWDLETVKDVDTTKFGPMTQRVIRVAYHLGKKLAQQSDQELDAKTMLQLIRFVRELAVVSPSFFDDDAIDQLFPLLITASGTSLLNLNDSDIGGLVATVVALSDLPNYGMFTDLAKLESDYLSEYISEQMPSRHKFAPPSDKALSKMPESVLLAVPDTQKAVDTDHKTASDEISLQLEVKKQAGKRWKDELVSQIFGSDVQMSESEMESRIGPRLFLLSRFAPPVPTRRYPTKKYRHRMIEALPIKEEEHIAKIHVVDSDIFPPLPLREYLKFLFDAKQHRRFIKRFGWPGDYMKPNTRELAAEEEERLVHRSLKQTIKMICHYRRESELLNLPLQKVDMYPHFIPDFTIHRPLRLVHKNSHTEALQSPPAHISLYGKDEQQQSKFLNARAYRQRINNKSRELNIEEQRFLVHIGSYAHHSVTLPLYKESQNVPSRSAPETEFNITPLDFMRRIPRTARDKCMLGLYLNHEVSGKWTQEKKNPVKPESKSKLDKELAGDPDPYCSRQRENYATLKYDIMSMKNEFYSSPRTVSRSETMPDLYRKTKVFQKHLYPTSMKTAINILNPHHRRQRTGDRVWHITETMFERAPSPPHDCLCRVKGNEAPLSNVKVTGLQVSYF